MLLTFDGVCYLAQIEANQNKTGFVGTRIPLLERIAQRRGALLRALCLRVARKMVGSDLAAIDPAAAREPIGHGPQSGRAGLFGGSCESNRNSSPIGGAFPYPL